MRSQRNYGHQQKGGTDEQSAASGVPRRGRGPAGSLPLPGLDLLLDRLKGPGHIVACRPAVQRVIIGCTQMPEPGIEVNIGTSHDR
jgi:hypothetical protein